MYTCITYIFICVCVFIYIYTHISICIYIHKYTYTYLHTYCNIPSRLFLVGYEESFLATQGPQAVAAYVSVARKHRLKVKMVLDGFIAPLTADNIVDFVPRKK